MPGTTYARYDDQDLRVEGGNRARRGKTRKGCLLDSVVLSADQFAVGGM